MGTRRLAREAAVQFLFQQEFQAQPQIEEGLARFWRMQEASKAAREFAEGLIRGVCEKMTELDKKIAALAKNWDLARLTAVDRNILRLAAYEMLFRDDIPPVVSINEAIELAKKFGTEDSGKFVNGILDELKKEVLRPARQTAKKPTKK
jgi:N utilization substance protein B